MKKIDLFADESNDPMANMNEDEFIAYVANDCINNMTEEEKQSFRDEQDPIAHHFGYGLYIRNKYIHGKDLPFMVLFPDDLSKLIIEKIIELVNEKAD